MKFLRNRVLMVLIAAIMAVFLVVSSPQPKQAEAVTSGLVITAINAAKNLMMDQIMNSISGMLGGIGDIILGDLMPFMEDVWQRFSREQRQAQIEQTRQLAEIEQAALTQEYINRMEDRRLDDMMEARVSDGECQMVTASYLSNGGAPAVEEYREEFTEQIRGEQNFAEGSITEDGPVAANMEMLNFRLNETCSDDEQRGNLADVCNNSDPENVDRDLQTELLAECHTFPKEDKPYVEQMIRYLVPIPQTSPLNQSVRDDPQAQQVYLERQRQQARMRALQQFVVNQVAYRMEPETCPSVPGGDSDRVAFVNRIDEELGRTPPTDRPCPSQAEFDCYRLNLQFQSPEFAEKCNEGTEQMQRCMMMLRAVQAELQHNQTAIETFEALMQTTENIEQRPVIPQPVSQ